MLLLISKPSKVALSFLSGQLPAAATFARASTGVYLNASGLLTSAANDAPRFDCNPTDLSIKGILIEPSATNINLYSRDSSNNSYSTYNVTFANAGVLAPDGNAISNMYDTATTNRFSTETAKLLSAGTYYFSVFLKQGATRYAQLRLSGSATGYAYVIADMSNGTIANSVSSLTNRTLDGSGSVYIGNGWYRFWMRCTATVSETMYASVALSNSASPALDWSKTASYTGTGSGYLTWFGFSLCYENSLSSYIPTLSASATRAADRLSLAIPSGRSKLLYTFDDGSTQSASVSAGTYQVPTNLNRPCIKKIILS